MGSDTDRDTENQVRILRGVGEDGCFDIVGYSCRHLTIISPLTSQVCSVIVIFSRYCRYCVLGREMVLINRLMAAQIQREGEECPCSE